MEYTQRTQTSYRMAATAALILMASIGQANLLANGSFEADNYGLAITSINGWTLDHGNVDISGLSFDQHLAAAADGDKYIELVGTPGSAMIEQTIATEAGKNYVISGFMSRHLGLEGAYANLEVLVDGNLHAWFRHDSPISLGNGNWQEFSTGFTATGSTTTIGFADATHLYDFGGVNVDGLQVNATPEPASMAVFGIGLAGFVKRKLRR